MSLGSFYTPGKHQKTFSAGVERCQWCEMGSTELLPMPRSYRNKPIDFIAFNPSRQNAMFGNLLIAIKCYLNA